MTLYEAIKTDMTEDDLIRLLIAVDANIFKKFGCNELCYGCHNCKDDFVCYRDFLRQEIKVLS